MTATINVRRFRISILIAVLLAAQMVAITHALAHVLHEETGKCFVCQTADHFKHCTVTTGGEVGSSIALETNVAHPTTHPTYPVARAFFARGPPRISS